MQVNIPIDAETMDRALAASGFATREEMLAHWLREYVKEQHSDVAAKPQKDFMDLYGRADLVEDYEPVSSTAPKSLMDLRGKIEFAEGYDYKALRKSREFPWFS